MRGIGQRRSGLHHVVAEPLELPGDVLEGRLDGGGHSTSR
jgi:hypothetical protein